MIGGRRKVFRAEVENRKNDLTGPRKPDRQSQIMKMLVLLDHSKRFGIYSE